MPRHRVRGHSVDALVGLADGVRGRSFLLATLALATLAAPAAAGAQKVPRIGFLASVSANSVPARVEAFRLGLRELGYVEGQNITIEWRWAEGRDDRLPGLAEELVRLKVDVIVTVGATTTHTARRAAGAIPIVFASAGDAVAAGLVASLARPGGNVTGLTVIAPDLSGKRLEMLKEVIPKLTRLAVLRNPTNPVSVPELKETQVAARALGLQLRLLEVQEPEHLESALAAAVKGRAHALTVLPNPIAMFHRARLVQLAAKHRLPAIYFDRVFTEVGGLLSYGANDRELQRRAATYVDKILKGAKPSDLPVEQPTRFELVINMRTAKALRITFPQTILIRADQVIQ